MGYIECNVTTFNGTGQGIYPESLTHVLVLLVSCVFCFFFRVIKYKETKRKSQRVKESKRQRDKETKRQRDNNTTRQKVKKR